jgi:hypothetical protein
MSWSQNLGAATQIGSTAAHQIYDISVSNGQAATAAWIQIFNLASGSVTLGTTAPIKEFLVPFGTTQSLTFPVGIAFGTAITIAATTTEEGATPSASGVIANVDYK